MTKDDSEEAGQGETSQGSPEEVCAAEKRISEISGGDPWVSVIGTVINRSPSESSFVLDDGTGQIGVRVSRIPELGSLVRVIARTFAADEKVSLDALIVQDFSCFDVELYRRILELEGRVFSQEEGSHP